MFRATPNSQLDAFGNVEQHLRPEEQKILTDPDAWYNVFFVHVLMRIDEWLFMPLFSTVTGRPNTSIRLLVGMLVLKEGCGWSDSTLFEAVRFNLVVRRALGLVNLNDQIPTLSTYYLFKQRLYIYQVENGVNLLADVFQSLTSDQIKLLGVIGEKLRMDSTLLGSNLATCTRLQLIIACLQVFWKSLSDTLKMRLEEADREMMEKLCAKTANQFVYSLEEEEKQSWLMSLGGLLQRLCSLFSSEDSDRYNTIERLLAEQYDIEGEGDEERPVLKSNEDISADSLQSPYDEDATYRSKKGEKVRGYNVNVTETCEEEEGPNLILDVNVESASTADNTFLQGAVDNSEAVLGAETKEVSADGAYYSEENEKYAEEKEKEIHYTGFPGKKGRYEYERTEDGTVEVTDTKTGEKQQAEEYKPGRYRFRVNGKWRYITDKDIDAAKRRRKVENLPRKLFNRRCNVEATIFQLCFHTRKKKSRYRGKFRIQMWAICRAAWINMRRIALHQAAASA